MGEGFSGQPVLSVTLKMTLEDMQNKYQLRRITNVCAVECDHFFKPLDLCQWCFVGLSFKMPLLTHTRFLLSMVLFQLSSEFACAQVLWAELI